jgi:hypothetical protein
MFQEYVIMYKEYIINISLNVCGIMSEVESCGGGGLRRF